MDSRDPRFSLWLASVSEARVGVKVGDEVFVFDAPKIRRQDWVEFWGQTEFKSQQPGTLKMFPNPIPNPDLLLPLNHHECPRQHRGGDQLQLGAGLCPLRNQTGSHSGSRKVTPQWWVPQWHGDIKAALGSNINCNININCKINSRREMWALKCW